MATSTKTSAGYETPQQTLARASAMMQGYKPKPVKPITVGSLTDVPEAAELVPQGAATSTTGALAGFQSSTDDYTKALETRATTSRATADDSFAQYLQATLAPGQTELTDNAYSQEGGVDDITGELDTINQQLKEEQHSLRRKLEALEKNPQGLFGGALEDAMNDVETASLRKQADLSIIQQGIQGRFDSAKAIADRAVESIMEKQRMKTDALRLNYERNQSLFDKDEQRAFETAQGERERKLQNEEYRLRAHFDQSLKQADPLYQKQLREADLQIQKLQNEVTGTNYNLANLTPEQFAQLPSADKNNTTLLNLFAGGKVSAGNKALIGNTLALARSAQDLAKANPDANFGGLYPFRGVVDFFAPEFMKREETVQNESFINSLNLQTQYWASGAALTDAQTELVMKMVPTMNDTDAQVKTKLNQLVNYMMGQTASRLQTDGLNFVPEQVNLFETLDLYQQASPEQRKELEELGLIPR